MANAEPVGLVMSHFLESLGRLHCVMSQKPSTFQATTFSHKRKLSSLDTLRPDTESDASRLLTQSKAVPLQAWTGPEGS